MSADQMILLFLVLSAAVTMLILVLDDYKIDV